jgi:hypothetical protein
MEANEEPPQRSVTITVTSQPEITPKMILIAAFGAIQATAMIVVQAMIMVTLAFLV